MSDIRRTKLSDTQQYVLQVLMNRGVMDHGDFKRIYKSALKKFELHNTDLTDKNIYSQFIREISDAIKPFNFEITKGVCEITGYTFYCYVRLFDPCSLGKLSALYSPTELKIFQILLPMIIESEQGFVSYNDIVDQINETYEEMTSNAQTQAEKITVIPSNRQIRSAIDMFISHYWIMELVSNTNMLTLHGRAIIELDQYFKEAFSEEGQLKYCFRCKKLCLIGIKCDKCSESYHRSCAKEIFNKHNACMKCKEVFDVTKVESLREAISEARAAFNLKFKN